jgi:predicted transglutaminase-like cysteine proteinase
MSKAFVSGLIMVVLSAVSAVAQSASGSIPVASAAMITTDTLPPIGWVQFCSDNPTECKTGNMPKQLVKMDDKKWKQLQRVNRDVNEEVEPISDMDQWNTLEKWSYPVTGKGDCEDYVLEKRRRLAEAGWPIQSLLITVVREKNGNGHAVLTVKTDRGDLVLDNQEARVKAWTDTGYRFIKRQSEENQNKWVSLGGPETAVVAASR